MAKRDNVFTRMSEAQIAVALHVMAGDAEFCKQLLQYRTADERMRIDFLTAVYTLSKFKNLRTGGLNAQEKRAHREKLRETLEAIESASKLIGVSVDDALKQLKGVTFHGLDS